MIWTFITNLKEWFIYRESSCLDTHIVNMFCSLWLVLLTRFQVFIFVNMNLTVFSFIIRLFGSFLRNTACMLSRFSHVWFFVTPLIAPPGSSAHGILQARILEWVTIPFSRGIFPTQGSNPGLLRLLHCRRILYCWATSEAPSKKYYLKVIKIFFLSFLGEFFIFIF